MAQFPRAETLIIESTYGGPDDIMPDREGVEGRLVSIVNETVEKNGKVLIPVPAVGRAQEIMLVLDAYMRNGALRELPIYIEGMVNEATAIHTAFPEYLVRDIKEQILHKDINPFQSEYFHPVTHPSDREEIIAGGPCVIIATSGMLEGGPAIDYFRHLAPDPRNTLAYVSYQVDGTLRNRIKNGLKEVSLYAHDGKMEMVKVNMRVESIEGFSGHSDRNQLLGFIKRMSPKPTKIIVNHGERRKSDLFAQNVNRIFGIKTVVPDVLESIRLRQQARTSSGSGNSFVLYRSRRDRSLGRGGFFPPNSHTRRCYDDPLFSQTSDVSAQRFRVVCQLGDCQFCLFYAFARQGRNSYDENIACPDFPFYRLYIIKLLKREGFHVDRRMLHGERSG